MSLPLDAQPDKMEDGRLMTAATRWWVKNTKMVLANLFCVHNVSLDDKCCQCEELHEQTT